jgi:hypothetical protein
MTMKMMSKTSSTSIKGVTLMLAWRAMPPRDIVIKILSSLDTALERKVPERTSR